MFTFEGFYCSNINSVILLGIIFLPPGLRDGLLWSGPM